LILVCFLGACQKWVPLEPPLENSLAQHRGKLRLTLADDERLEFDFATVSRDSVFGIRGDDLPTAVPLSTIAKAEQRKANVVGTILLSYAAVAAVVIPVVIVTCTDEDGC
jgi:hypothetical protein